MKVQEAIINEEIKYILIDSYGIPVIPVVRYIKYLDNIGKAHNTIKSYSYHLKLYFEYLEQISTDYIDVNLNLLAEFISWLRKPSQNVKVLNIEEVESIRSERTINTILTCVVGFYNYLMRTEEYEKDLSKVITTEISGRFKTFRPFLHHLSKSKSIEKRILKIKEPKRKIRVLTHKQVQVIHDSCMNIRDILLIRVMYEGGLRIGEVLSLWLEDFDISSNSINVRKSKTKNGENRKVFIQPETMNLFQEYICKIHSEDIDTNYVFINLQGKKKGTQLRDWAVRSLVKRLKKKTNIDFTPHMFRHSFASELYNNDVNIVAIQKLLGHAQIQTTIQTYIHPREETIRKEWEKAQKNKNNQKRE